MYGRCRWTVGRATEAECARNPRPLRRLDQEGGVWSDACDQDPRQRGRHHSQRLWRRSTGDDPQMRRCLTRPRKRETDATARLERADHPGYGMVGVCE